MDKSGDRDFSKRKSVDETSISANTCIDDMVEETPPCASCTREPEELPSHIDIGIEWQTVKEDPNYLISLVDEYITVYLKNNRIISGFVHCVDSHDFNIILNVSIEGTYQPICIPDFTIQNVIRSRAPSHLAPPPRMTPSPPASEDEEGQPMGRAVVVAWYPAGQRPPRPGEPGADDAAPSSTTLARPNCLTEVYAANVDDLLRTRRLNQNSPGDCEPSTSH